MSIELTVSLIAAVVALGSAALTGVMSAWAAKGRLQLQAEIGQQQAARQKQEERQDLMSKIRDPVLWAAYDLQSRIFNIVAQRFLSVYLVHGTAKERAYAQRNTLFVLAQYLGWVEIVRRSVQFLDIGSKEENLELVNCLSKISGVLSSDSFDNSAFRIFRGDQRAIGEIMIDDSVDSDLACIGYAKFGMKMDTDQSFAEWFTRLSTDVEQLAKTGMPRQSRLVALQHNMIDLIDILDPEFMRFPDRHRRKLYQYDVAINSQRPGCFILLVDQSSSMNRRIAGTTISKQQAAADAVNTLLYEAVLRATRDETVSHRFDIGVFGYGGEEGNHGTFGKDLVPINKIALMAKPPQKRVALRSNTHDHTLQQAAEVPIWLEPVAQGQAVMSAAFEHALTVAKAWTRQHPTSFPPIIINITGGSIAGKDPTPISIEIQSLYTQAGNPLVFTCHISETEDVLMYPGPSKASSFDKRTRQLYGISSVLPELVSQRAHERGYDLEPGARAYVLNGDVASLIDFLEVGGTRVAEL